MTDNTTETGQSKKPSPNKYVARVNEKAVGLNIFLTMTAIGDKHFAEVSKAFPGKRDADGNVEKWHYTTRLFADDCRKLAKAATAAAERLDSLDADIKDSEEYPTEAKAA